MLVKIISNNSSKTPTTMNLSKVTGLFVAATLLFSFSACTEDAQDTLTTQVQGSWMFDESATAYSAGLLLDLSGQGAIVDTMTVLATVNSLFGGGELTYLADSTGSLSKHVVQTETSDSTSLAGILNGYVGQLLQKDFTYTAAKSKIAMKMGNKTFTFTVLAISETNLKVSMPLTDLTGWMSNLLGERVSNITESSIFVTIDLLAATLGVYASPTVTMTFTRAN
jgi:hypothetical protein